MTARVAPCVSQTGAASDLCATFESGVMKGTHQAVTTSLLLGPRSPGTPGVSPPTQAAHSLRVEGRGCGGDGAGRRWVLEQGPGREEPCTFPQARPSARCTQAGSCRADARGGGHHPSTVLGRTFQNQASFSSFLSYLFSA